MKEEKNEVIVEAIEKKREERRRIPKEEAKKINKLIFPNILIANVVMLFFIFLILGFTNIERTIFVTDLKVFSLAILVVAILLFEQSYKKEDSKLCYYGIETVVLAISILISIYICILQPQKFASIMASVSYIFSIYYVAKALHLYQKGKRDYQKTLSDIPQIVKKEKPEKKEETKRKNSSNKDLEEDEVKKPVEKNKESTKETEGKEVKTTTNTKDKTKSHPKTKSKETKND